jgi:hypothetical protein
VISYISWKTTSSRIRIENTFHWAPIQEVAFLFAAIFVTMIPALAILAAGRDGSLAPLLATVSTADGRPIDAAFFWLAGGLSSFLDNAPTYLVFFNLAGGNSTELMGPLASTLVAISAGAVFMGANTYIGNAPNFMVRSICDEQGIRMPGFFAYMLWSGSILLPLFGLLDRSRTCRGNPDRRRPSLAPPRRHQSGCSCHREGPAPTGASRGLRLVRKEPAALSAHYRPYRTISPMLPRVGISEAR